MNSKLNPALAITFVYLFISIIWILTSNHIVHFIFSNSDILPYAYTIKGIVFIILTSLMLYFLINHFFNKERKVRQVMEDVFNNSGIPLTLFDEKGKALSINEVWLKKTGYRFDEISTFDKWAKIAFKENEKEYKNLFLKKLYSNKRELIGELKHYTKDERVLVWIFYVMPFDVVDEKKIYLGSAIDVTELRTKESILIQQTKMATMGEMLGNIAHQWKQPLNVISISNSLIKMSKDDETIFDNIDNWTTNIDNSVQNLSNTIDDFRNFFNPNKNIKIFNTNFVFEKTFKLIRSQLNANEIEIVKDIEDIDIEGYENELLQVLINIIINAREQLIKINPQIKVLIIEVKSKNGDVIIKIKDSANGIAKEYKNRIFDNHFTTKSSNGGSGIGLYMCKQIIEQSMKGKIKAYNIDFKYNDKNCRGAIFVIKIPKKIN